jgi:hypothetical protein
MKQKKKSDSLESINLNENDVPAVSEPDGSIQDLDKMKPEEFVR